MSHHAPVAIETVDAVALHRAPEATAVSRCQCRHTRAQRVLLSGEAPSGEQRPSLQRHHQQTFLLTAHPQVALSVHEQRPYPRAAEVKSAHRQRQRPHHLRPLGHPVEAFAARTYIPVARSVRNLAGEVHALRCQRPHLRSHSRSRHESLVARRYSARLRHSLKRWLHDERAIAARTRSHASVRQQGQQRHTRRQTVGEADLAEAILSTIMQIESTSRAHPQAVLAVGQERRHLRRPHGLGSTQRAADHEPIAIEADQAALRAHPQHPVGRLRDGRDHRAPQLMRPIERRLLSKRRKRQRKQKR